MEKIFWTQAEKAGSPNIIFIDDNMFTYTGTDEQQEAMGVLIEARTWPCLKVISERRHLYNSFFHVAVDDTKRITIRSYFFSNRKKLSYTYYSRGFDLKTAISDVKNYAKKLKRDIIDSDFEVLEGEMESYVPVERDIKRDSLKTIGGGYEKIWQYIRRH